jgi:hypothetical protein
VQTWSNDECLTQIRRRHFDVAPALRRVVHGLCRIDSIHVGSRRVYLSRLDRYLAIALNTPYQGGVAVVSRTYPRFSVWHKTRFRLFSAQCDRSVITVRSYSALFNSSVREVGVGIREKMITSL